MDADEAMVIDDFDQSILCQESDPADFTWVREGELSCPAGSIDLCRLLGDQHESLGDLGRRSLAYAFFLLGAPPLPSQSLQLIQFSVYFLAADDGMSAGSLGRWGMPPVT